MEDKDIQLIEQYIDGSLSCEELTAFNQRLMTDKSFAKAFREREILARLWKDGKEYEDTKKFVGEAIRKMKQGFFITYRYQILSVAAAVIVLLGGYILLVQERGDNPTGVNRSLAVSDTTTVQKNTFRFKVDEPLHLAAIDTVPKNIRLVHPIDGTSYESSESITFMWEADQNLIDTILVRKDTSGALVSRIIVNLSDSAYTMKYPMLEVGNYTWNLAACDQIGSFSIIDDK